MPQIALLAAGLVLSATDPVALGPVDGADLAPFFRTEFRASGFGVSTQHEGVLAPDGDGGLLAAWTSRRQENGRYGAYVRRFDLGGTPSTPERPLHVAADGAQRRPTLASGPAGPVAAWSNEHRPARVLARRPGIELASGAEQLIAAGAIERAAGVAATDDMVVVAATDPGLLAAWVRTRSGAAAAESAFDVVVRPLDGDGAPAGPERTIDLGPDAASAVHAQLVAVSGDRVLLLATALDADARPIGVRAIPLDARGAVLADPVTLAAGGAIEPAAATIAAAGALDADRAAVLAAWMAPVRDGYEIRARPLDAFGRPVGPARTVAAGPQVRSGPPALAPIGELGDVLVAWSERGFASSEDEPDLVARVTSPDGAPRADAFRLARAIDGPQALAASGGAARLVALEDGGVAAIWSGDGGFGDGSAVHVTVLHPEPRPVGPGAREGDGAFTVAGTAHAWRDEAALPHRPPTFDAALVDPEAQRTVQLAAGGEVGFDAVIQTPWTPPDPQAAVGPDHVVAVTNGAIRVFDKEGTLLFEDEIEDDFGFWGEVGATGFVFDPEVLWDPHAGRFWAMAAEAFAPGSRSFVLFAASETDDPTGPWLKWRYETTDRAGNLFDSPNVGVDESALVITGDAINGPGGPTYPMFVFNKISLLFGGFPIPLQDFLLPTSTQSAGLPPVTSGADGTFYFVEHRESATNTSVRVIAVEDALTAPTVSSTFVPVPAYQPPTDPPQAGTSARPNTFDARFWSAAWRDGTIYGTHHVGAARVLARWYEIDVNDWPASGAPTLVQSGEIDPGPGIHTFFPALGLNGAGDLGIVFSQSSSGEFISMRTAVRAPGDAPGTLRTPDVWQTNVGGYPQERWGDYAAIDGDPADPQRFWAHHEYAAGTQWRTWLQGFEGPTAGGPAEDLTGDGEVDFGDLLELLAAYGPCPGGGGCPADFDGDGEVGFPDLLALLAAWTGT